LISSNTFFRLIYPSTKLNNHQCHGKYYDHASLRGLKKRKTQVSHVLLDYHVVLNLKHHNRVGQAMVIILSLDQTESIYSCLPRALKYRSKINCPTSNQIDPVLQSANTASSLASCVTPVSGRHRELPPPRLDVRTGQQRR
jgi:hypothetical protein